MLTLFVKNIKQILSIAMILTLTAVGVVFFAGCGSSGEEAYRNGRINIIAMNGPTGMGLGHLRNVVQNDANHSFSMDFVGTPAAAIAALANRSADVASIPANTAAVLFNQGNIDIQVVAINATNVLHLVQRNGTPAITMLADLAGRTVFMPGQGATPETAFRHLLAKHNVQNVNLQFESEGSTIVAGLSVGTVDFAILPQPAATVAVMNGSSTHVLNLTPYWQQEHSSDILTGVLVVRRAFLQNNRSTFDAFMAAYQESIDFMNNPTNIAEAAQFIVDMNIVPNVPIATAALPQSGITLIRGQSMKDQLTEFYQILHTQNPNVIGGQVPGENFFLVA